MGQTIRGAFVAAIAAWGEWGSAVFAQEEHLGVDLLRPHAAGDPAEELASPNVGLGPLRLASMSPFQSLRMGLLPRAPSNHPRGHWDVRESFTWANQWAHKEGEYLLDFETLGSSLALTYGLSDSVEVEMAVVRKERRGGLGDGLIQGFHDAFGIDQSGRDEVPRNAYAFRVGEAAAQEGAFADYLVVSALHTVTRGDDGMPAIAYSVALRGDLREAPDVRSARAVDAATSIAIAKRYGRVYGYLAVGVAYYGSEAFHGFGLRRSMLSVLAAAEWRVGSSTSLVLQYHFSQGAIEGAGELSEPSHEVALGWKGEVGRATVLEIALIENVITFDNSPDFGVHVGLSYRL